MSEPVRSDMEDVRISSDEEVNGYWADVDDSKPLSPYDAVEVLARLDGAEAILRQLARVESNANDELWDIRELAREWFQARKG
jgi:hypothetical protein